MLCRTIACLSVAAVLFVGIVSESRGQSPGDPDLARTQHVLAKARRGEPVTVGVIGGSITEGARASSVEKNYGSLVAQWWRGKFPKADVQLVNAGIGATGSNYGALRAARDLLSKHPDFIIAEYSVNDPSLEQGAETLEGLVRQALGQPNQPAVVQLFMMTDGGHNAQEWHGQVGAHYGLPRVSFRDALWPEMAAGRAKWADYEADGVHPNDRGHAFAAKLVTDLLEQVLAELPPDAQLPAIAPLPSPKFSARFEHTALYEAGSLEPLENQGFALTGEGRDKCWKATEPGSRLVFEVEGRVVLLMDFRLRGPMGKVKIQIDDRPALVRDTWFEATWGGFRETTELARDLAPGKHRLTIEVLADQHPESTGHEYRLLGIGAADVGK